MSNPVFAAQAALDSLGIELTTGDVRVAVDAASASIFSPENLARTVSATGLSLQTVTEVARELRQA
jgi:hypothetical protein